MPTNPAQSRTSTGMAEIAANAAAADVPAAVDALVVDEVDVPAVAAAEIAHRDAVAGVRS